MNWVNRLNSLITARIAGVLLLGLLSVWVLYLLLGHRLIETMYTTAPGTVVDRIMAGKSSTPLEQYLEAADTVMVLTTFRLLVFLLVIFLLKKPRTLLYGSAFVAALSFVIFCVVERFPSVGDRIYLDRMRLNKLYIADDKLVHKLRAHLRIHSRAGQDNDSFLYGIKVQPTTVEWMTDEDGFRNADTTKFSDLVIIGDGFIEEGQSLLDTFANRIAKHLPGVTVRNLGTGGHGPFQYLEVLKRYGIKRNPKYALIAFNEVNDILDVQNYLQWQRGQERGRIVPYDSRTEVVSRPFFERYTGTLLETFRRMQNIALTMALVTVDKFNMYQRDNRPIHKDKDVVSVELEKQAVHRMLFIDHLIQESPEQILASDAGRHLKDILLEFQRLCVQSKIVPMIVFIPSAAHIYAEYSTQQSGRKWLRIRAEQIAAKRNVEQAISTLTGTLGIELINLTDAFESAAKNGKMLYYPLSTHWNSEGREIAAALVADVLKRKMTAQRSKEGKAAENYSVENAIRPSY